jgi:hypothetical protein
VKIALVGSEPESHGFAPWDDSSWEIWSCGLSSEKFPRVTRHFEVHALDLIERAYGSARIEAWVAHLNAHPAVYSLKRQEQLPNAQLLDVPAMFKRFSPYFFSATACWMLAKAIMDLEKQRGSEKVIGLWGIDCSATEEYMQQRPGVQFFLVEAMRAGIRLEVPLESDILQPNPQYGLREFDNQFRKTFARKRRLDSELAQLQVEAARTSDRLAQLGALTEYLDYQVRTWSGVNVTKRSGS